MKRTAITLADALAVLQAVADRMHAAESRGHAADDRMEAARSAGKGKAFRLAKAERQEVNEELDAIDMAYQAAANLFGAMVFEQFPEPLEPSLPGQRALILPGQRVAIVDRSTDGEFSVELVQAVVPFAA